MAEWDAATVKINYALKAIFTGDTSAVLSMGKLSGPNEITVLRMTIREGGDYAVVTLDSTYLLSIHSSHGTWAYRWHDTGGKATFVEHLLQMNAAYLTGKLNASRPQVFDDVSVVRSVRNDILNRRRRREMSSGLARDLYKYAEDIYNWETLDEYEEYCTSHQRFLDVDFRERHGRTTYEPGIVNFMSAMWPLVQKALQVVVAEFAK
jgi:hypothetical protein